MVGGGGTVCLSEALVLEVLVVAALLGKINEVGQNHAAEANMVEWIRRTGFDVLGVVVIQSAVKGVLDVIER